MRPATPGASRYSPSPRRPPPAARRDRSSWSRCNRRLRRPVRQTPGRASGRLAPSFALLRMTVIFFQELYWQKESEPADRCGSAAEGRARETRLPSAADAGHSEHAPDFQCARARRRPLPAAPPPSWLRLRGAAFPVRQLGLVGFQEVAGEDAAEEGPQTLRLPSGQLSVLTGRARPGCTPYSLDRRTSKWRSEQNWSKVENALGPYSVTGPSASLRCLIIQRTKQKSKSWPPKQPKLC